MGRTIEITIKREETLMKELKGINPIFYSPTSIGLFGGTAYSEMIRGREIDMSDANGSVVLELLPSQITRFTSMRQVLSVEGNALRMKICKANTIIRFALRHAVGGLAYALANLEEELKSKEGFNISNVLKLIIDGIVSGMDIFHTSSLILVGFIYNGATGIAIREVLWKRMYEELRNAVARRGKRLFLATILQASTFYREVDENEMNLRLQILTEYVKMPTGLSLLIEYPFCFIEGERVGYSGPVYNEKILRLLAFVLSLSSKAMRFDAESATFEVDRLLSYNMLCATSEVIYPNNLPNKISWLSRSDNDDPPIILGYCHHSYIPALRCFYKKTYGEEPRIFAVQPVENSAGMIILLRKIKAPLEFLKTTTLFEKI